MKRAMTLIVLCVALYVGIVALITIPSPPNGHQETEVRKEAIENASYFFSEECLHVNAVRIPATEATCTETGRTEFIRCYDCGYYQQSQNIPALGHDMCETEIAATCEEAGLIGKVCSRCGERESTEVPALGHDLIEINRAASCTEDGFIGKACTRCDYSEGETVKAAGHAPVSYEEISADCLHTGYTGGSYCAVCKLELSPRQELERTEHRYLEKRTEATCTEVGELIETCEVCGDKRVTAIAVSEHDFEVVNKTDATCEHDGTEESVCVNCGERKNITFPKLGHDFGAWRETISASCEEEGRLVRICSHCGFEEINSLPPTGHVWSDWTESAVTCSVEGERERICSVCQISETETVAAHGHLFGEWQEISMPTCTESGLLVRYCAYDHTHTESRTLPATGHTNIQTIEAVAPTCTRDGHSAGTFCLTCGEAVEEVCTILAHGHVWDEGETVTRATYTAAGTIKYTCAYCKEERHETVAMLEGNGALFLAAVKSAEEAEESQLLAMAEYALELYESVEFPEFVIEEYERLTALYERAKKSAESEEPKLDEEPSNRARNLAIILSTVGACTVGSGAFLLVRHFRKKSK